MRKPVGARGAVAYGLGGQGGYLDEDEKDVRLRGTRKYRTYSAQMVNVAIVGAAVRLFLYSMAKPAWSTEAADEGNAAAVAAAELADLARDDMHRPWSSVVQHTSMAKYLGFSIGAWHAKARDDGAIGIADVAPRPQHTIERWGLDEHGYLTGVWQRAPDTQREIWIPRDRMIYAVDDALRDSPEGLGLMRHVVKASTAVSALQQIERTGYETDLAGVVKAWIPLAENQALVESEDLTESQRTDVEEPLRTFAKKHIRSVELGLVLESEPYRSNDDAQSPSSVRKYDAELMKGGGVGHEPIGRAIERENHEIARVLGVEHLLLGGIETGGNRALGDSKIDNFLRIVESALDDVVEVMNHDYIGALARLNGWPREIWPSFKVEPLSQMDIVAVTDALANLAKSGAPIMPSDPAVPEIYERMRLTPPPEDQDAMDALGGPPQDDLDSDTDDLIDDLDEGAAA